MNKRHTTWQRGPFRETCEAIGEVTGYCLGGRIEFTGVPVWKIVGFGLGAAFGVVVLLFLLALIVSFPGVMAAVVIGMVVVLAIGYGIARLQEFRLVRKEE